MPLLELCAEICFNLFVCIDFMAQLKAREKRGKEAMTGDNKDLILACTVSGALFSFLGLASFAILWAVNWRPWRIYRYLFITCCANNYYGFWLLFEAMRNARTYIRFVDAELDLYLQV